jgi:hydrogenase nickel incorporation protein HypB
MCISCGCMADGPESEARAPLHAASAAAASRHWHRHADGSGHSHEHAEPGHEHSHDQHAHGELGRGAGHVTETAAPGPGGERRVRIERDILAHNDAIAGRNRRLLERGACLALNLVSSPGAGKTSLLCRTIRCIGESFPVVVIEGDQQTSLDADRIRATGAPALQINTGKGCHLDAAMVERALGQLDPPAQALVLIENVGNLVCPAAFDLGEDAKVVVLSVTEGDDKPLKYPDMFAAARLMLVNKIDLQPHCDFDPARALEYARRVNPGIDVISVSARDGTGFDAWLAWIDAQRQAKRAGKAPDAIGQERGATGQPTVERAPLRLSSD